MVDRSFGYAEKALAEIGVEMHALFTLADFMDDPKKLAAEERAVREWHEA